MSIKVWSWISISGGIACPIDSTGNGLYCFNAGFWSVFNDIANPRPPTDTFPFGGGFDGVVATLPLVPVEVVAVGVEFCAGVGLASDTVVWITTDCWLVVVDVDCEAAVTLWDDVWVEVGFSGLTGLVGFVGFVTDCLQLFDVVTQGDRTGWLYGVGHVVVCVCWIEPVYPDGQAKVCVWTLAWQVGGLGTQVLLTVCQGVLCPFVVVWRVCVMEPL